MTLFSKDLDKVLARAARLQQEHDHLTALKRAIERSQTNTQQTSELNSTAPNTTERLL